MKARTLCAFVLIAAHLAWPGQAQPDTQLSPADWPTYHGATTLAGFSPATIPDKPALLWKTPIGGDLTATPVACNGLIFCVNNQAEVIALNLSGARQWTTRLETPLSPTSSTPDSVTAPLICGAGHVIAAANSGNVYALHTTNGTIAWRCALNENILGSPNWLIGPHGIPTHTLVLTQPRGIVHAINLQAGTQTWQAAESARCDGSAATDGTNIVFGNCASTLYVLSASNGRAGQNIPLGDGHEIAGGNAMAGSLTYAGNRSGSLICADLATRTVAWSNLAGRGECFTTPATDGRQVAFISGNGVIYLLDARTGAQIWSYHSSAATPQSLVLTPDKVIASVDGSLLVIHRESGQLLSQYALGDSITSPAIVGNRIIVGTDDGAIVALGHPPATATNSNERKP